MWIYIIIIVLFVFCIFKERQALGCKGWLWQGKDCDNGDGKAVKGSKPHPNDSKQTLLNKIKFSAAYHQRFVKWRIFVIVSIIASILIFFLIKRRVPSEWEMVICMMVLFLCMSLATNFYRFHLYNHISKNIDDSVEYLEGGYSSNHF